MFDIKFGKSTSEHEIQGKIYLGERYETFLTSTEFFSRELYISQWKNAIYSALNTRQITALFTNIQLSKEGYGHLWLFNIIPAEEAGIVNEKDRKEGVYVTQQFFNITVNTGNFRKRIYCEDADGASNDEFELSLYYLDMNAPEKFYGYLDGRICGVSSWHYNNLDFETFVRNTT